MIRSLRAQFLALSTVGLAACGGSAQLDQSGPSGGGGHDASAAGARDGGPSGGTDASSTIASGGGGASSSSGGNSSGAAGTTANGGGAGAGGGVLMGGAAGANAGGTAGGTTVSTGGSGVEADAGSPLTDPHADQRRTLAEDYCAVCGSSDNPTVGPDCVGFYINNWYMTLPEQCWDELAASIACSKANNCAPLSGGLIGAGACLAERTALGNCTVSNELDGVVAGSVTSCSWNRMTSGTSCAVGCVDHSNFYSTSCAGPPDGPFECWCELNGRQLVDSMISNGGRFYVDTCEQAAGMLADGHCHAFTNCCYTFTGPLEQGAPEQTLCECTSDPTYGGQFSSCEALAVSHKDGAVIDLCPGYLPQAVVP